MMLLSTFVLLVLVVGLESHPVGSQGPCNRVQNILQALDSSSIPDKCKGSFMGAPNESEFVYRNVIDVLNICNDDVSCYDDHRML